MCVGGIIRMLSKTILELSYMASYRVHISYQNNKIKWDYMFLFWWHLSKHKWNEETSQSRAPNMPEFRTLVKQRELHN